MLTKPYTDRELIDIIFAELRLGKLTQAKSDHLIKLALDLLPV